MAAQSHTKPLPPATPPRTAFLTTSAISSRLKHMMTQRKNTDLAKSPPSQTISPVSTSASSSGYASSSSSSSGPSSAFSPSSGFVSASSPGGESPPRLKRLASSRKGIIMSLLGRMVASASNSGKKRDSKGKGAETEEETGEVEYILFDGEGNPAYCPGSKHKFMGNLK